MFEQKLNREELKKLLIFCGKPDLLNQTFLKNHPAPFSTHNFKANYDVKKLSNKIRIIISFSYSLVSAIPSFSYCFKLGV